MRTFVAVVVGRGRKGFVQSIHVAAESYRKAAALVLRRIRQAPGVRDLQLSLREVEATVQATPGILATSWPVFLDGGGRRLAS